MSTVVSVPLGPVEEQVLREEATRAGVAFDEYVRTAAFASALRTRARRHSDPDQGRTEARSLMQAAIASHRPPDKPAPAEAHQQRSVKAAGARAAPGAVPAKSMSGARAREPRPRERAEPGPVLWRRAESPSG